MAARAWSVVAGMAGAGVAAAGGVLALLFIAFALGGSVYRTDCVYANGTHMSSWGLEGYIPYLWSPNDNRCEAHTLTRYLLGQVGVMGRVNQ